MQLSLGVGAMLILVGGILQGTFAIPMNFASHWKHENIWFVFALTGLVIFPWSLTVLTIPSLAAVYALSSWRSTALVVSFGIAWGIGATLTGVGLRILGIGLGLAIILGLSASLGSLFPLLVLNPERIFSVQGAYYLAGTAVMLAGIGLLAFAGVMRERSHKNVKRQEESRDPSFATGLSVTIAAGILSSMLNFSFAFGDKVIENAKQFGASDLWASNAVTTLATTGGFIANAAYCLYMLRRNDSFRRFRLAATAKNWLFGAIMGAFWYGGLTAYGIGIEQLGSFGVIVGWPLFMGTIIIASSAAGFLSGEWKGVGTRANGYLLWGSGVILISLVVLSMAHREQVRAN